MTQAIPGEHGLHSEPFIVDTVLAQTTFRKSYFGVIKRTRGPQFYHYQPRLGVKTLLR